MLQVKVKLQVILLAIGVACNVKLITGIINYNMYVEIVILMVWIEVSFK